MCGRYAQSRSPAELAEEFEAAQVADVATLPPDYNVAPTKKVYAVLSRVSPAHPAAEPSRADRSGGPATADVVRRLTVLRWGLVPSWAKDLSIGNRMVNARLETAADKPSFRRAFARRRCILPADGYYEWYTSPATSAKQPFFVRPRDGSSLPLAGLYEIWRDPSVPDDDAPGAFVWTCTVLTTSAADDAGRIHDRAPLLVPAEHLAGWLDPTATDAATAAALLLPATPGRLDAYPVSTLVNNVRNNGPQLLDPIPAEQVVADAPPA